MENVAKRTLAAVGGAPKEDEQGDAWALWEVGLSPAAIAKVLRVDRSSVYKWLRPLIAANRPPVPGWEMPR